MAIGILLLLLAAMPAFAGDAHVSKTGTLYLDKTKSFNGYHLFTSIAGNQP